MTEMNETATEAPAQTENATPEAVENASPAPETTEPTQAEIAAQMKDAYAFKDEPQTEDNGEQGVPGGQDAQKEETPYALEFSEGTQVDPAWVEMGTKLGKELGLDGKALGAYTERMIAGIEEAEYANMVKTDAALKADWGADYNARKQEVNAYLRAFCNKRGYGLEKVAVLASPEGYRLVYDLMESGGMVSTPSAGFTRKSAAEDVAWARGVLNDPSHPDYKAFRDTSNRRKWEELNTRYDKIVAVNKL